MGDNQQFNYVKLKNFEGCYMPSNFFITKERIEDFEVRNEDIWVTSYPKAGTTWTQEMVWLIANDLDYEGAKVDLDYRFPFIEMNCLLTSLKDKSHDLYTETLKSCVSHDMIKLLNETPGRRMIKTHLPWYFLPRQITNGFKTPKIIHVMRDPKQVAISYFHHNATITPLFEGNLDDFIDLFIEGKVLSGDYFKVVQSYWKNRDLPNLLIITYEEMHKDLKAVIKKVCKFLEKNYDEEEIDKLADHLSFQKMRANEAVNKHNLPKPGGVEFIRKGMTDSYKSELSEEMINKLNKWIDDNVKDLPYDIK
ncbi:luciferin sulfotransferase-like [Onthophagus taurus]|uniref:luciferin sulfotransferase-like n=1 Tax=Onthophagus taurus TaxID=166361 RepID=UPI0039BE0F2D